LVMVNGAVPLLVTVKLIGDALDPTNVPGKVRLAGVKVTAGAVPTPLIGTVCGLPEALSLMLTSDERLPVFVGSKVTLMVQLLPAANDEPQLLVCENEAALPVVILIKVMVSEAVPLLVRVTGCGVLLNPNCWLPKLRLVGDRVTVGCAINNVENERRTARLTHRQAVYANLFCIKDVLAFRCSREGRTYFAREQRFNPEEKLLMQKTFYCAKFFIIGFSCR
jgi:hypothetical protein